jgi:competence protein ComFC
MKAISTIGIALDLFLPRSCVLCGRGILPGSGSESWPICAACSVSLRPWEGERCPVCGLPLISELGACMRCRSIKRAFDSAYPLFSYSGPISELIAAYKKGRRRSLSGFFARLAASAIEEKWPDRTIVPVPPRPGKIKAQGWDQIEEIVRALEARGLPVARPLVRRDSAEQKSLGRGERAANASKAYGLKKGERSPLSPLLLDDVITTCSTLDACARALRQGGASSVLALALAID